MRALESAYDDDLGVTGHRPYPLQNRRWRLRQRWLDLLFAHWPIAPVELAARLPPGLEPDLYDGSAWLGVVPFRMDQVRSRIMSGATVAVPGTSAFCELNLRTYVRSTKTGRPGVFFYALDCSSLLSVLGARTLFHLPYFPARMSLTEDAYGIEYASERQLTSKRVRFEATYRPAGGPIGPEELGRFLTERYRLFTPFAGGMLVGEIHHGAWPLQAAEAEIRVNDLPAAHGFTLPDVAPVLYFSRELRVSLWGLEPDVAKRKSFDSAALRSV